MNSCKTLIGLLCLTLFSCSAKEQERKAAAPGESLVEQQLKSVEEISIPMLSLSETGEIESQNVSPIGYHSKLQKLFPTVEKAVIPAVAKESDANPWGLRTVVVGIGLRLKIGGSKIGIGGGAGIRMAYSNSVKPSIP